MLSVHSPGVYTLSAYHAGDQRARVVQGRGFSHLHRNNMLGRLILGTGVSASAVLGSQMMVAHAAEPKKTSDPKFAPIYDDETPSYQDPLPGTIYDSVQLGESKAGEAEKKLEKKVEKNVEVAHSKVDKFVNCAQSKLKQYTQQVREFLDQQLSDASNATEAYGHKYREGERNAAQVVASLKSEKEDLLPQSIYVLVTGLSGSIFARKRNFVVRAVAPWLFGAVAFRYFLPETFDNTRKLFWRYEQEQLPTLAKKHEATYEEAQKLSKQTVDFYQSSEKQVAGSVKSLRQSIREWTGY